MSSTVIVAAASIAEDEVVGAICADNDPAKARRSATTLLTDFDLLQTIPVPLIPSTP
jgi:hypothetical protein